jgi:hypothetical protein
MADELLLKWGTLKAWHFTSEAAQAAFRRYVAAGEQSLSAMAQRDTPEQKAALCEIIDAADCEIVNDWTGEVMSKDDAKKYVMEYRS